MVGQTTEAEAERWKFYGPDGPDFLGNNPLFGGGWINFGFCAELLPSAHDFTETDRYQHQADLYRHVLRKLRISSRDTVVEIGSGLGTGAALSVTDHGARVCGIDASPYQVARAIGRHRGLIDSGELAFVCGSAEALPVGDSVANAVLSVEVLQHVDHLAAVVGEAHRVLTPGGRLALATFFATDGLSVPEITLRIPTFSGGADIAHPLASLTSLLTTGWDRVAAVSIGEYVWEPLNRWLYHLDAPEWTHEWIACYRENLLDYYVVTAERA
jgi:ubiquinone/menaquinone biosynthesis C-methylase UbiE